jgi:hypothetical protein
LKEPCSKTLDVTRSEIRNPPGPDQSWSIQVDERVLQAHMKGVQHEQLTCGQAA